MCTSKSGHDCIILVPTRLNKIRVLVASLVCFGMIVFYYRTAVMPHLQCNNTEQVPRIIYRWAQKRNESDHTDLLPVTRKLQSMSWFQLAELYHRYIENIQVLCVHMVRLGNLKDGGWDVCNDEPYTLHQQCLIYSFSFQTDYSFEEDAVRLYGCSVHYFDPSTTTQEHRSTVNVTYHATGLSNFDGYWRTWRMRILKTIAEELGHQVTELSLLKIDIDEWEWKCLPDMLTSGALDNVPQLLLALHITIKLQPKKTQYLNSLITLRQLYRAGYRIFYTKRNLYCSFMQIFDGREETGCHNIHMIRVTNINFSQLDIPSFR